MNIGIYSFEEYKDLAAQFHGYPAPGILVGGYMVELAKAQMPEGTLFEAISESAKCLPDAIQLLTLCSVGNNWMKIQNLGKYALSLYDKYTGQGVRVSLDCEKMKAYPEICAWFLKLKPKHEQNNEELLAQIKAAGHSICNITPIQVKTRFLGKKKMSDIGICSLCKEAYPTSDGNICRSCQGFAPYLSQNQNCEKIHDKEVCIVPVEEAVGKTLVHDMTQIQPESFKGVAFKKGDVVSPGDLCRLQQMGRFHVAVEKDTDSDNNQTNQVAFGEGPNLVHENEAILTLAPHFAGNNVNFSKEVKEGKISFTANCQGVLQSNVEKLYALNLVQDMMVTARHNGTLIKEGSEFAGARFIPLFTQKSNIEHALEVIDDDKLFSILPLRKAKVGILVTGTEVFKGIIEDRFMPIIEAKVKEFECDVLFKTIVPDEKEQISKAIEDCKAQGVDLLITTGGLSVDPDDMTRDALSLAGMQNMLYGVPLLPGAMSLVGDIRYSVDNTTKSMQVLGVPACALYFKTTAFDVLLPKLLANMELTREDLARFSNGGFCMQCKYCTYPHCSFAK